MKLTQEQIKILKDWKLDENIFFLQGQLDRKQYTDINKVLETIGLKWNRGKKAHIADITWGELQDAIQDICDTGEVETLQETIKKFQFFPTPSELADYIVELADIWENDEILEPSAGDGAIVKKIIDYVRGMPVKIYANEIHRERYLELKNIIDHVSQEDFLKFKDIRFNKIIMNPPFSKNQDIKHILHAYSLLEEWGRVVSIASASIQSRNWKLYDKLKELNPEFLEVPAWSFKESGTMVNTVILILNK